MSLPLLREPVSAWTHGAWLLLALPATVVLWRRSRGDRPKQLCMLVFGLSLMCCYGGSALFHAVRVPPDQLRFYATLDFIGIYLLIAGTCTPVAFTVLQGRWQWGILALAWTLAAVGVAWHLFGTGMPYWLNPVLYLGMGWGVALCYFELARALTHRGLAQAWAGGLLYSVGAVIYAVRWPVPWPGVFNAHDLFHVFVMAGSVTHFWFMRDVIAPFRRQRAPGAA